MLSTPPPNCRFPPPPLRQHLLGGWKKISKEVAEYQKNHPWEVLWFYNIILYPRLKIFLSQTHLIIIFWADFSFLDRILWVYFWADFDDFSHFWSKLLKTCHDTSKTCTIIHFWADDYTLPWPPHSRLHKISALKWAHSPVSLLFHFSQGCCSTWKLFQLFFWL